MLSYSAEKLFFKAGLLYLANDVINNNLYL